MTLDARAMEWASEQGLDTKTLKAGKIPIYGKWYFPELPAGVPMINLKTGEIQVFGSGLQAGEVLFVARADLRRARLGPYAELVEVAPVAVAEAPAVVPVAEPAAVVTPRTVHTPLPEQPPPGIHLPSPSIFPLLFAVGLTIALLGLAVGPRPPDPGAIIRPIVMALGAVYLAVAVAGWVSQNQREQSAIDASDGDEDHGDA